MTKISRKGPQKYHFYLFSDCLMYGYRKGGLLSEKKLVVHQTCTWKNSKVTIASNAKVRLIFI